MNSYEQQSIFDLMYSEYKIQKPIRLIELFAGYGSQALALKYLNVEFQHWKICEWAVKSIQAYKDLHFSFDNKDYSLNLNREQLESYLLNKGISRNYNNPMNKSQINRLNENTLRTIYNNIIATNNLVNIQQVKGEDLEIKDNNYTYLLTYSFPCQDLSLAGKGKGMENTSTRSGMLWEVERILKECNKKPDILLMENVPQVHGIDNMNAFTRWQLSLESMGYKNYYSDLSATDYEIPQTRVRCFMISILGDYNYKFPKKKPLKIRLKDLEENNVDEKYFLSEKMINCFMKEESGAYPRKQRFEQSISKVNESDIANTITTNEGNRDISTFLLIKNATKKGYLEATIGDGIDISSRMQYHRGTVQKGKSQTLTTQPNVGIVVFDKYGEVKIRKLTPRECFRLMGVKDEDYDLIRKNQSDSSLYHLAGDSIVVNVLMAIIKQLYKE